MLAFEIVQINMSHILESDVIVLDYNHHEFDQALKLVLKAYHYKSEK